MKKTQVIRNCQWNTLETADLVTFTKETHLNGKLFVQWLHFLIYPCYSKAVHNKVTLIHFIIGSRSSVTYNLIFINPLKSAERRTTTCSSIKFICNRFKVFQTAFCRTLSAFHIKDGLAFELEKSVFIVADNSMKGRF